MTKFVWCQSDGGQKSDQNTLFTFLLAFHISISIVGGTITAHLVEVVAGLRGRHFYEIVHPRCTGALLPRYCLINLERLQVRQSTLASHCLRDSSICLCDQHMHCGHVVYACSSTLPDKSRMYCCCQLWISIAYVTLVFAYIWPTHALRCSRAFKKLGSRWP